MLFARVQEIDKSIRRLTKSANPTRTGKAETGIRSPLVRSIIPAFLTMLFEESRLRLILRYHASYRNMFEQVSEGTRSPLTVEL